MVSSCEEIREVEEAQICLWAVPEVSLHILCRLAKLAGSLWHS